MFCNLVTHGSWVIAQWLYVQTFTTTNFCQPRHLLIQAPFNCCIVHEEELHLNLQFHSVLSTNHNRPIQKIECLAKHCSILVKLCLIKPPQGKNNSRASTEQQLLINNTSVMVRSSIKDSTKSKTCQKSKVGHSVLNNYTMKQRF